MNIHVSGEIERKTRHIEPGAAGKLLQCDSHHDRGL